MNIPLTDIESLKSWIVSPDPGPEQVLAAGEIGALQDALDPEEKNYVERAVEKRVREFTAGRSLARLAMQLLGEQPRAVHAGDRRQPLWPQGLIGSITHCDSHCACALARTSRVRSVGIDMEHIGRVKQELWRQLFTSAEQDHLEQLDDEEQRQQATIMFSAKEAFYKLQYPLTGSWLNFTDAEVYLLDDNQFELRLFRELSALPAKATLYRGSYSFPYAETVLSQVWSPAD
jgi:phosphopantetheine--protein transferase-like protein